MLLKSKVFLSVFAKGLFSLFVGVGIVAVVVLTSTYYSYESNKEAVHPIDKIASQQHMDFPKSQDELNKMSEKLAKEASSLSDISPASGE